jgi:hypothetical protein
MDYQLTPLIDHVTGAKGRGVDLTQVSEAARDVQTDVAQRIPA